MALTIQDDEGRGRKRRIMPGRTVDWNDQSSWTATGGGTGPVNPAPGAGCAPTRIDDGFNEDGSPDANVIRPIMVDGFALTMRTLLTSVPAIVISAEAYSASGPLEICPCTWSQ